jgi:ribosomal protein S18 acetylase RimI-like enzyme
MPLDLDALDNAVWHSLHGIHASVAEVAGTARRYPSDVSVFSAVDELDGDEWDALAKLVGPGGAAVLFRRHVGEVPSGWRVVVRGTGHQMVAPDVLRGDDPPGVAVVPLGPDDADRMLALTALTKPGPFQRRTVELGAYLGVEMDGELVAMAGERLAVPGGREVSAVCTHPDYRGRGLGALLCRRVAAAIRARDETAFLHVAADNHGARDLYERLGFQTRAMIEVVVATRTDPA